MIEHLEDYLLSLADEGKSQRTIEQYSSKLRVIFEWLGDRRPTPALLQQFRIQRQTDGRRPRTIRVDFSAFYDFCEFLEETGRDCGLPRRGCVKMPRMDDAVRESPTLEEVDRMFDAVERMPAHTDRKKFLRGRALAVLTLLAYAGMRRGELLALNTADIWREGKNWKVYVRLGKGAQPRQVDLGDTARAYLDEWLAIRRRWCHLHAHASDALLPVDSTRRLSHKGLDTLWDEILEMAQINRRITPHGMRHFFGSFVEEAEGLKTAQEMLGHKRPETTFGYLKSNAEKKGRAANAFTRNRTTENGATPGSNEGAPSQERRLIRRTPRRPSR